MLSLYTWSFHTITFERSKWSMQLNAGAKTQGSSGTRSCEFVCLNITIREEDLPSRWACCLQIACTNANWEQRSLPCASLVVCVVILM